MKPNKHRTLHRSLINIRIMPPLNPTTKSAIHRRDHVQGTEIQSAWHRKVAALGFAFLLGLGWLLAPAVSAADMDFDGLDDTVERQLIDRHAPYLAFDSRNAHWPCSATWFVQHSELIGNGVFIDQATLAAHPELALQQNARGESSALLCTMEKSGFTLNLLDDYRRGEDPSTFLAEGRFNVGMYAHVFRAPGDPRTIIVQYLQLSPFNDSQFPDIAIAGIGFTHIGDHEGDWLFLEVYVTNDGTADYPVQKIVWHHHGDATCPPDTAGPGHALSLAEVTLNRNGKTPMCYLEEGTHEWWPLPADEGTDCQIEKCVGVAPFEVCVPLPIWADESHDGRSQFNYQTAAIPNLGKIWAPMPGPDGNVPLDNLLVLHFNGKWGDFGGSIEGDPPYGPILQGDSSWWSTPGGSMLFPPPAITIECDRPTTVEVTGSAMATWGCYGPARLDYTDQVQPGPCPQAQNITRRWTATWPNGDTATGNQQIMVIDSKAPVLTLPSDVTLTCGEPTGPEATGSATARDNCDPSPAVRFQDAIRPTICPADPVMYTIARTWTATDACGNSDSEVQTITVLKIVAQMDIKPGSTSNPINVDSRGVVPITIFGSRTFDASEIKTSTIRLARADCRAGTLKPIEGPQGPHSVLADSATPVGGAAVLEKDGFLDLGVKFDQPSLGQVLELRSLPNRSVVEIVLEGELKDGCKFLCRDRVTLRP